MRKEKNLMWFGSMACLMLLTACGSTDAETNSASSEADNNDDVTKIMVAYRQDYNPYDYVTEDGKPEGFEVKVLEQVDEKLADYEFEFVPTSDEDLLIGLESGKYDVGIKGAWYTEERAKKFIMPEEPIGASVIGITFRTESGYTSFEDFAENSGKLIPISPQNAQWTIIEGFNEEHSETPVELIASEQFTISDAYQWLVEGRYDAYFDIKLQFENAVVKDEAPYHSFVDQLSYIPYKAIPTYPIIHKSEKNEVFAEAYNNAIKELTEEGEIQELSEKYFGENVFELVEE